MDSGSFIQINEKQLRLVFNFSCNIYKGGGLIFNFLCNIYETDNTLISLLLFYCILVLSLVPHGDKDPISFFSSQIQWISNLLLNCFYDESSEYVTYSIMKLFLWWQFTVYLCCILKICLSSPILPGHSVSSFLLCHCQWCGSSYSHRDKTCRLCFPILLDQNYHNFLPSHYF